MGMVMMVWRCRSGENRSSEKIRLIAEEGLEVGKGRGDLVGPLYPPTSEKVAYMKQTESKDEKAT